MKVLGNCLIIFWFIPLSWGSETKIELDITDPLDEFIEKVIAYCKKDRIPVVKNNGDEETIDTPKYISDFGLGLKSLKDHINNWKGFLEAVEKKVKGDTKTNSSNIA